MQDLEYLKETIRISFEARKTGNHPFGALLVNPEGEIVIRSGNTYIMDKGIGHAELNVARDAALQFETSYLDNCTLVTSVEPCCMCAGSTYWAGIGILVFGITEKRLAELTGDNPENLTMDLTCHTVFAAGQRKVVVRGPFQELEASIVAAHEGFW